MTHTWVILLPVILIVVIAIMTRRAFDALIIGTLFSCILLYGGNFFNEWVNLFVSTASDPDNQWILLMCGLFGSIIALLRTSNGANGFIRIAEKYCSNRKKTLLTTFIMGAVIFIDDYLNMITVGVCMRKVYDDRKLPREALAYIMDSTGTPVCVLLPFSTWAAFYISLFLKEKGVQDLGYANGISLYMHLIPYIFYAILTVVIVLLFSLGDFPLLGSMKSAFRNCGNTKLATATSEDEKQKRDMEWHPAFWFTNLSRLFTGGKKKGKLYAFSHMSRTSLNNAEDGDILDFILPLGILIVYTLLRHDILKAILVVLAFDLVWYVPRKKMNMNQWGKSIITGFGDMIPTLAVLLAALMFAECCSRMGLADYVIETAGPHLSRTVFPAGVFLLVSLLTFSTSSTWGVSTIVVPVILPLAVSMHANLLLTMAAILSGSTFGSHACFYSDATLLASSSSECDNMAHAETQIPYALIAAGLSVVLYMGCGIFMH